MAKLINYAEERCYPVGKVCLMPSGNMPIALLFIGRYSEGHVSVRFGDLRAKVWLNGANVSNNCVEALAEREGYVGFCLFYTDFVCDICGHAKVEVIWGDVRVEQGIESDAGTN